MGIRKKKETEKEKKRRKKRKRKRTQRVEKDRKKKGMMTRGHLEKKSLVYQVARWQMPVGLEGKKRRKKRRSENVREN